KHTYETLNSLLTKSRQLPSVNPDAPEQAQLNQFPSQKIIDAGSAIMKQVEAESSEIVKAAVEMNQHKLLVPGSLPAASTGTAIGFRNAYLTALPPLNPALPGNVLKSRFAQELKAGMPPTTADIALKQAAM